MQNRQQIVSDIRKTGSLNLCVCVSSFFWRLSKPKNRSCRFSMQILWSARAGKGKKDVVCLLRPRIRRQGWKTKSNFRLTEGQIKMTETMDGSVCTKDEVWVWARMRRRNEWVFCVPGRDQLMWSGCWWRSGSEWQLHRKWVFKCASVYRNSWKDIKPLHKSINTHPKWNQRFLIWTCLSYDRKWTF